MRAHESSWVLALRGCVTFPRNFPLGRAELLFGLFFGFYDTSWPTGLGELGFGDGDEATLLIKKNPSLAYYFRKKINLPFNPQNVLFIRVW